MTRITLRSTGCRAFGRVVAGVFLLCWAAVFSHAADPTDGAARVEPSCDTAELLAYLAAIRSEDEVRSEVTALIRQLSDPMFHQRREAFEKLPAYGVAARRQVVAASRSDDPEVRNAAIRLLPLIDERAQSAVALTLDVLKLLQARRSQEATPVLLTALPKLVDSNATQTATHALWACTGPQHADRLMEVIGYDHLDVRTAAIVALELAVGAESVARIEPLLNDAQPRIRLAAARALLDRRPRRVLPELLRLTVSENVEVVWQADALLRLKTGHTVDLAADETLGDAWRRWADDQLSDGGLGRTAGRKRLDLAATRGRLVETFDRDKPWFESGYRKFYYEATNGARARVAGGRLYLDGSGPEGDQRLAIDSQRMFGRATWPNRVTVRARLGGADGNNVGRHVGISVGRVKVLFHPGYSGGGFRAETTDDHAYLFNNESMNFDPAADSLHEMTVEVTRSDTGADFAVTMADGDSGAQHVKEFSASKEELGPYNRIGLERSGRTGGDAWFDRVEIELKP